MQWPIDIYAVCSVQCELLCRMPQILFCMLCKNANATSHGAQHEHV